MRSAQKISTFPSHHEMKRIYIIGINNFFKYKKYQFEYLSSVLGLWLVKGLHINLFSSQKNITSKKWSLTFWAEIPLSRNDFLCS